MSWLVQFWQGHADFFNRNKSKNMTGENLKYVTNVRFRFSGVTRITHILYFV